MASQVAKAVIRSGLEQPIVNTGNAIHGHVKLPAELACETHAQRNDFDAEQANRLGRHPRECLIAEVDVRCLGEDAARCRTCQRQKPPIVAQIPDRDILARQHVLAQTTANPRAASLWAIR